MKIADIIKVFDEAAPAELQESYDNAGLIIGSPDDEVKAALITLDVTEEVIEEAINLKCDLIIAHHPLIFKGLKSLGRKNPVERMTITCIRNNIAVFAIHTNLDNVLTGVNLRICDKLKVKNPVVLEPKRQQMRKLVTFCPADYTDKVRIAIFEAGAGHIGDYDYCSFNVSGQGTFRGLEGATPFVGKVNELHFENEVRIETIFPVYRQRQIVEALLSAHPYEEVAYDIYPVTNEYNIVGAGMIGSLDSPVETEVFFERIKNVFNAKSIRHTKLIFDKIQRVAVCGGSGSFLLGSALARKADIFVTADVKYHDFFEADGKIIIADIGHFESEQFTPELIKDILLEKIPTFATRLSQVNTNPVFYYL
jgi:dinuclear metal center YbgI/SA1388 family protein